MLTEPEVARTFVDINGENSLGEKGLLILALTPVTMMWEVGRGDMCMVVRRGSLGTQKGPRKGEIYDGSYLQVYKLILICLKGVYIRNPPQDDNEVS